MFGQIKIAYIGTSFKNYTNQKVVNKDYFDTLSVNVYFFFKKYNNKKFKYIIWEMKPLNYMDKKEKEISFQNILKNGKKLEDLIKKLPTIKNYLEKKHDYSKASYYLNGIYHYILNNYKSYKCWDAIKEIDSNLGEVTSLSLKQAIETEDKILEKYLYGSHGVIINPNYEENEFIDFKRISNCFCKAQKTSGFPILITPNVRESFKTYKILPDLDSAFDFIIENFYLKKE